MSLAGFSQPLKKVRLTIPLKILGLPGFEGALEKFASAVELLSFPVSTDEEWSRFVVNLFYFPNTKTLDFHCGEFDNVNSYEDGDDDGGCRIGHVARVRFTFPGGDDLGIKYDRHLPSIRAIIVKPMCNNDADDFWNTYGGLFDSLLPKEGDEQRCKTLRNFDIPNLENVEVEIRYR